MKYNKFKIGIIKTIVLLVLSVILFLLVPIIINYYFVAKKSLSFGILIHYGNYVFTIFLLLSAITIWCVKNIKMRVISLVVLSLMYLWYWFPSIKIYPFRVSLIVLISLIIALFFIYSISKIKNSCSLEK